MTADPATDRNEPTEQRTRSGVYLGCWRGIRFYLDYSWFIIAALVVYSLSTFLFPHLLPERSHGVYIAMGIAGALLFFLSIILHELGHSVVSQRCGIPVPSITLLFIGGVAELSREPDDPRSELKIAVAGPAVSLVLVGLFALLAVGLKPLGFTPAALVFGWLAQVNLALVIFNAIPGYPLDGGRVLRALLWMRNGKLREATYITSRIGIGFSMLLIFGGIFFIFAFGAWNGLIFIFIGIFLRNAAEGGYTHTVTREVLAGVSVAEVMTRAPLCIPAQLPLNLAVDDFFLTNHHVAYPVVEEEGRCLGLLRLEHLQTIPRERWPYTSAAELVASAGGAALTIGSDACAADTLRTLLTPGQGRLGVLDAEGKLVGILTRHDLLHYIRIQSELNAGS